MTRNQQRALAYAEDHRKNHAEWLDYFERIIDGRTPITQDFTERNTEGLREHGIKKLTITAARKGASHNRDAIRRYNIIIKAIEE